MADYDICPYYHGDYKKCNLFDTTQEEYQRKTYCISKNDWKRCANYTGRSFDEKMKKKLRPNPDL